MNNPLKVISDDGHEITFARVCPFCGKEHKMKFDSKKYFEGAEKYNAGAVVQVAFPDFTVDQREFLISGICNKCWNSI